METLTLRLADGDPTVQLLLSLGHSDSSHGLGKCNTKQADRYWKIAGEGVFVERYSSFVRVFLLRGTRVHRT